MAGTSQRYRVIVQRQDEAHALASSHGHILPLGIRRGDPTAGFNAAETLLAALGACLITNVNTLASKMRLRVDDVRVEIEGDRLILDSPEPLDKLEKLHDLAFK